MEGVLFSEMWGSGVEGQYKTWCVETDKGKIHITLTHDVTKALFGDNVSHVPCDKSCIKMEELPAEVWDAVQKLL